MKSKILVSCVSILAIIFVSLMPVISQAFEKNQSIDYQVICSSNGLKVITSENLNQNDINNKLNLSRQLVAQHILLT